MLITASGSFRMGCSASLDLGSAGELTRKGQPDYFSCTLAMALNQQLDQRQGRATDHLLVSPTIPTEPICGDLHPRDTLTVLPPEALGHCEERDKSGGRWQFDQFDFLDLKQI